MAERFSYMAWADVTADFVYYESQRIESESERALREGTSLINDIKGLSKRLKIMRYVKSLDRSYRNR